MNIGGLQIDASILFNVAALGVSAYGVVKLGNWVHDYLHPCDREDHDASPHKNACPPRMPKPYPKPSHDKPEWLK